MIDIYVKFQTELINAFYETFFMIFFSMLLSLIIGLVLGFLLFIFRKDGIKESKVPYFLLSSFINMVRSIPFVLFIIVMIPINRKIVGTGFGIKASVVPLSIIGIATFARLVEQDLLDVNKNIYETSYALGASHIQYFKDFLLVEARSGLVLSYTSTIITLLSYSTVMGFIGGGGLGYLAISEGYNNFNYGLMWLIILIMLVIVQLIQYIGNKISRLIDYR